MRRIVLSLLITCLVSLSAVGAALDELQKSYQARQDEVVAERIDQSTKLRGNYVAALKKLMEREKESGKLEKVIPIKEEIALVQLQIDPLPALSPNVNYKLKGMRVKFTSAHGKILKTHAAAIVDLADKMTALLEAKQTELTKAGDIDEAIFAKKARNSLAADDEILAARALLAASNGRASRILRGKRVAGDLALKSRGVTVVGIDRADKMIDGDAEKYNGANGWAVGKWPFVLEVDLKDVFAVERIALLLYDVDDRKFKYKIEVSEDHEQWNVISDRSKRFTKNGWQEPDMEPRDLRYLRITCVENSVNEGFHIVELVVECDQNP